MAFRSLVQGALMENSREDWCKAVRFGTFRVGSRAIYFPSFPSGGKYLAYPDITKMLLKPSSLHPKGCCGGGIPIYVLRLEYGDGQGRNLILDSRKLAERVAGELKKVCPELAAGLEI